MKRLHHLDKADHVASGDCIAIVLERWRLRRRPSVEHSWKRRFDFKFAHDDPLEIPPIRPDVSETEAIRTPLSINAARMLRAISRQPGVSEWKQIDSKAIAMSSPSTVRTFPSRQARTTLSETARGSGFSARRVNTM